MADNAGKTVAEILQGKQARVKNAPLEEGSPGWDEILHLTWEEVDQRARARVPGFRTFRKLLTDKRFDK
jgi:hypothetical protein